MISIVVPCIGKKFHIIIVQCIVIQWLMVSIVVQWIGNKRIMISIVVNCIAYDKHSCAMHRN